MRGRGKWKRGGKGRRKGSEVKGEKGEWREKEGGAKEG